MIRRSRDLPATDLTGLVDFDFDRVRASALANGGIKTVGPPPFGHP
jgi:hypothetical protein